MKTVLIVSSLLMAGICAAQTNSPATTNIPPAKKVAKVIARPASALPEEVVQADARIVALAQQSREVAEQIIPLERKRSERSALQLAPDPGVAIQLNQLRTQQTILADQTLKARQWDYQVRELHHLPQFGSRKTR